MNRKTNRGMIKKFFPESEIQNPDAPKITQRLTDNAQQSKSTFPCFHMKTASTAQSTQ